MSFLFDVLDDSQRDRRGENQFYSTGKIVFRTHGASDEYFYPTGIFSYRTDSSGLRPYQYELPGRGKSVVATLAHGETLYVVGSKSLLIVDMDTGKTRKRPFGSGAAPIVFAALEHVSGRVVAALVNSSGTLFVAHGPDFVLARSKNSFPSTPLSVHFGFYPMTRQLVFACEGPEVWYTVKAKGSLKLARMSRSLKLWNVFRIRRNSGNYIVFLRSWRILVVPDSVLGDEEIITSSVAARILDAHTNKWKTLTNNQDLSIMTRQVQATSFPLTNRISFYPKDAVFTYLIQKPNKEYMLVNARLSSHTGSMRFFLSRKPISFPRTPRRIDRTKYHVIIYFPNSVEAFNIYTGDKVFIRRERKVFAYNYNQGTNELSFVARDGAYVVQIDKEGRNIPEYFIYEGLLQAGWTILESFDELYNSRQREVLLETIANEFLKDGKEREAIDILSKLPVPPEKVLLKISPRYALAYLVRFREAFFQRVGARTHLNKVQRLVVNTAILNYGLETNDIDSFVLDPMTRPLLPEIMIRHRLSVYERIVPTDGFARERLDHCLITGRYTEAVSIIKETNDPELLKQYGFHLCRTNLSDVITLWRMFCKSIDIRMVLSFVLSLSDSLPPDGIKEVIDFLEILIIEGIGGGDALNVYVLFVSRLDKEDFAPFLPFLQRLFEKKSDLDYNLLYNILLSNGKEEAAVHLLVKWGKSREAVELALRNDNPQLVREVILGVEDADLRNYLWVLVCETVLRNNEGLYEQDTVTELVSFRNVHSSALVRYLTEGGARGLDVWEVLVRIPLFKTLKPLKKPILEYIAEYERKVKEKKRLLKDQVESVSTYTEKTQSFRKKHLRFQKKKTCSVCHVEISHGPILFFPCGHTFHESCYNRVADEISIIKSSKEQGCVLCGKIAVMAVRKDFVTDIDNSWDLDLTNG